MAVTRAAVLVGLGLLGCSRKGEPVAPPAEVSLRTLPTPVLETPRPPPMGAEAVRLATPEPAPEVVVRPPPMGAEALREASKGIVAAPGGIDPGPGERPPPMGAEALRRGLPAP